MRVIRSLLEISLLTSILSKSYSTSSSSYMKTGVTLLCFDVDGTLIHGSSHQAEYSAHARAFGHATGKVFNNQHDYEIECPSPLLKIESANYHGCTDGLISLHLARAAFGVPSTEAFPKLPSVFKSMYDYFSKFDDDEVIKGIEPLPGVIDTLQKLSSEKYKDRYLAGLVTGNVEGIARKKMRATGIFNTGILSRKADDQTWDGENETTFLGGFGSDFCSGDIDDASRIYKDRGEQIMIAYRRAKTLLNDNQRIVRVVHVGDAPADVLAARYFSEIIDDDISVGCLAVATGKFSRKTLEDLFGNKIDGKWEPIVLEKGLSDENFIKHCKILDEDN